MWIRYLKFYFRTSAYMFSSSQTICCWWFWSFRQVILDRSWNPRATTKTLEIKVPATYIKTDVLNLKSFFNPSVLIVDELRGIVWDPIKLKTMRLSILFCLFYRRFEQLHSFIFVVSLQFMMWKMLSLKKNYFTNFLS